MSYPIQIRLFSDANNIRWVHHKKSVRVIGLASNHPSSQPFEACNTSSQALR